MSIVKITQLRNERVAKVKGLLAQLDQLKGDTMYSDEYKNQKEQELKAELRAVRQTYDPQITELINSKELELTRGFYGAEFEGLTEKQAMAEVLKELRSQGKAKELTLAYKERPESLLAEAEKAVRANLPTAAAYLKAGKELGIMGMIELEDIYTENNMNDMQRAYQNDLRALEEEKKEYAASKLVDVDLIGEAFS